MFKKILIANRGEIAMRVVRTCKEMGIKTVVVYSTADRNSLAVRFADESVCIGGPRSTESYLNIPNIIAAAEVTNADAIHPGYGFLSENTHFSRICQEHGIVFIGPSPQMISMMGDKAVAKATMQKANVPTIPGSPGVVSDAKQADGIAQEMGYPILLKAVAGGGGKGMRIVSDAKDLESAWQQATTEAGTFFGNSDIYIEKLIEEPHHIEIQVFGDKYNHYCHLSERDCSIQRRHQKLIEEAPSPFVDEALQKKMGDMSVNAISSIGYEGAGTIEYLVDKHKNFYFMEMNTRIQVEHPVTEQVTKFDLVKEQIRVAVGEKISQTSYFPKAYSIECRVNAENPHQGFMPSPGKITYLHLPGGMGIRVDTHVYSGYTIPTYYDSMIAKLIATGQSREQAISRMLRALEEFMIEGIHTTIPFHLEVMKHPDFIAGNYDTSFLEKIQPL